ncbi:hypothetical protein HOI83_01915 [Candidatus Uhrbacteria bacterium]|nr:hypothetical protein [Candidatus Uhrbacteria bacterium]
MFHRTRKMKPIKRALFSLLIAFSVIIFWRGAWGLLDIYFLPNNYTLSSALSIVIGLSILAVTHYWTKELE